MSFLPWALVVIGCTVIAYRQGYREGIEVARRMGQLAVEQERFRCKELRMTQVFGPRAERLTRPTHAECNS